MRRFMPILATIALGCSLENQPGPGQHRFLLPPGEVELSEGQAVEVGRPNAPSALFVTFTSVLSDSRCPVDVRCIWEGDAAVLLSLSGEVTGDVILHFPTATAGPTNTEVGPYRIELKDLMPALLTTALRPRRYHITLAITWRP